MLRKFFRSADKTVDRAGYWSTAIRWLWSWVGGSAVIGLIASFWDTISSEGWAAVVLFGIFGAALLLLVFSIGAAVAAYAYRKLFPIHADASSSSATTRMHLSPITSSETSRRSSKHDDQMVVSEVARLSLRIDAHGRRTHGKDNIVSEPIRIYSYKLKARERFSISRVVCLCQRPGRDFPVDLSDSIASTTLQAGEDRKIVVAHFTQSGGHLLGPPLAEADETARLKMKELSHFSGTMRCRLVVETDQGDVSRDFNLIFFNDSGPPNITDCQDFKRYNPDDPMPANGWFLGPG